MSPRFESELKRSKILHRGSQMSCQRDPAGDLAGDQKQSVVANEPDCSCSIVVRAGHELNGQIHRAQSCN